MKRYVLTSELDACEDFLRSVLAVALRRGNDTNWEAFEAKARERLKALQDGLGYKYAIEGGDTCTAKTFVATECSTEMRAEPDMSKCLTCPTKAPLHNDRCIECWANGYEILFIQREAVKEDLYDAIAALKSVTEEVDDIGRRRKVILHGGTEHALDNDSCPICAFLKRMQQPRCY